MEWMRKQDKDDSGAAKTRKRQDIYESLQHQRDALMVESDIRLFESHHFDKEGRVAMSPAELKFPSTAFGELRRIANFGTWQKETSGRILVGVVRTPLGETRIRQGPQPKTSDFRYSGPRTSHGNRKFFAEE